MMGDLRSRRYRECAPRETVERIRGILSGLKLLPAESFWRRSGERFFSLRLSLPGTCVGVNGKGVTPEYALASAYGELMERLQNMADYRLRADMPPRAHRYGGFLYAPDEIPQNMGEILSSEDPWMRSLWDTVPDGTDRVSYLRRWKQAARGERQGDFYGIPFESLADGQTHILPMNMLSALYLTNGMCAGNTREEALVHGLCECLERYAVRMAVAGKYPLRVIDRKRTGEKVESLLRALEEGGYAVQLYDASLGLGLPVTAALLTDKGEGTYLMRFGAGPDPGIAMERALSELMQGQRMERVTGMRPIHAAPDIADPKQNIMSILTHGFGAYPFECFGEDAAGELPCYGADTMEETLTNLIGLVRGLGYEPLTRDVSFLGFPAAHVLVPGMSEIGDFGDREELCRLTDYQRIKGGARTLCDLSPEDAGELLALLDKHPLADSTGVLDLLNLDISGTIPWYYRSVGFLKLSLALTCGDTARAAALLHAQAQEQPSDSLYYRCARDVCLLRESGGDDAGIQKSLTRFYPEKTVSLALTEMRPDLYRRPGTIHCFDCDGCPYHERCGHPGAETLYKQLKRRMREYYEEKEE